MSSYSLNLLYYYHIFIIIHIITIIITTLYYFKASCSLQSFSADLIISWYNIKFLVEGSALNSVKSLHRTQILLITCLILLSHLTFIIYIPTNHFTKTCVSLVTKPVTKLSIPLYICVVYIHHAHTTSHTRPPT